MRSEVFTDTDTHTHTKWHESDTILLYSFTFEKENKEVVMGYIGILLFIAAVLAALIIIKKS